MTTTTTNFPGFGLEDHTTVLDGDYVVGYRADGTAEFRITVAEFLRGKLLVPKGTYAATSAYTKHDVVNNANGLFYALSDIAANAGYTPGVDTTHWGTLLTMPSNTITLAGDVTGTPGANTTSKLQGLTLSIASAAEGDIIRMHAGSLINTPLPASKALTDYVDTNTSGTWTAADANKGYNCYGGPNTRTLPALTTLTHGDRFVVTCTGDMTVKTASVTDKIYANGTPITSCHLLDGDGLDLIVGNGIWILKDGTFAVQFSTSAKAAFGGTGGVSTLSGDVIGAPGATTVTALQGVGVTTNAPTDGQGLVYNASQNLLVYATPQASGSPNARPAYDHIVICVFENHPYSAIVGNTANAPYINNTLITEGVSFSNYFAIGHPSEPNYMALYAGSDFGIVDDGTHTESDPSLYTALNAVNKTFKGFPEDSTIAKHNPWQSFPEYSTPTNVEALFSTFPTNFTTLPNVAWVTPNLTDDMHDGTIAQGDTWLQTHLDPYVQWAKANNSLFILVFDEDDSLPPNTNQVPCIMVGAKVVPGVNNTRFDHYSVLRLMCETFGAAPPRNAATAAQITGIWGTAAASAPSTGLSGDASALTFTQPAGALHGQAPVQIYADAKLAERVSILDFLPKGFNGGSGVNCYSAFVAASAYCADTRELYVPVVQNGYFITGRNIPGPKYMTFEKGANIQWNPGGRYNSKGIPVQADGVTWDRLSDLDACFTFDYQQSVITYPNVQGVGSYTLATLVDDGYVKMTGAGRLADGTVVDLDLSNPDHFPDYYNFLAPGFAAYKVINGGKVTFVTPFSDGVKFGCVCDSTDGHVQWVDNERMQGLFALYIKKNSEDYLFHKGGFNGILGCVLIGNQVWAGHNGGMALTAYRMHLGYSPYNFFQVHDNYVNDPNLPTDQQYFVHPDQGGISFVAAKCGGIYGEINACSYEEIGEARYKLLSNSVCDIHHGRDVVSGWADNSLFMLPTNMLASNLQRKYLFWLGEVQYFTSQCEVDALTGYNGNKLARIDNLTATALNANCLRWMGGPRNVDVINQDAGAESINVLDQNFANRGSQAIQANFRVGNLLKNPEVPANYAVTNGTVTITDYNTLIGNGELTTAFFPDINIFKELGPNPTIIKVVTAANGAPEIQIPLNNQRSFFGQELWFNVWVGFKATANVAAGIYTQLRMDADPQIYINDILTDPNAMVRIRNVGAVTDTRVVRNQMVKFRQADVGYIAGPMLSTDRLRPYSKSAGLWLDVTTLPTSATGLLKGEAWLNNGVLTFQMT